MRLAQIGTFDFANYGDLLFADVLERQMQRRSDDVTIDLFSPFGGEFGDKGRSVYRIRDLEEMHTANPYDAFVIGGGDILNFLKLGIPYPNHDSPQVPYELVHMWAVPIVVAWKFGIPVMFNAPGLPESPFVLKAYERDQARYLKALAEVCDYVSLRDHNSERLLRETGYEGPICVVPDSVLSVATLYAQDELEAYYPGKALGLERGKYLFFQCNNSFTQDEIARCAQALNIMHDTYGIDVLFQPIGFGLDDQVALAKVQQECSFEVKTTDREYSHYEVLSLIANCACYLGSSLHGCITANAFDKPCLIMNRNGYNKTEGFVQLLGREYELVSSIDELESSMWRLMEPQPPLEDRHLDALTKHFDTMFQLAATTKPDPKRTSGLHLAESIVEATYRLGELDRDIDGLAEKYLLDEQRIKELEQRLAELEGLNGQLSQRVSELETSTSWRVTKPLRALGGMLHK